MSLPVPFNVTCDLYHTGNAPPADADASGLRGHLSAHYATGLRGGAASEADLKYTHILLVDSTVDIRDDYEVSSPATTDSDAVYIPDQDGTKFVVVFVEMIQRDQTSEHKRVYLRRTAPTWPTNEV